MKTEITKARGWWKHLLLLCVTLLGVVGFATAAPNYPFPNNYAYPNGKIYTGNDVQSKIQSLYATWKSLYYEESGNEARVKFVQAGEDGSNSVSEGIAYGMLITVYMDNATNNTQGMFDKIWAYYKANMNEHKVMNWKVKGFTHQVASPTSANANGATDADLDAAQALLMAYKQWGKESYLTDAQTLINQLWTYEVNDHKHLKPGDMFDDYKNPCYFITNAMKLFTQVKQLQGWSNNWDWNTVASNCYTTMKKAANSTTGLIPDWCYEDGSYLQGIKDGKFESIFGYDAVRIPWRMAHAYAWYGDQDAYDIAKKITTWASTNSGTNQVNNIVDGYYCDGRPGDGNTPFTGSLKTWGQSQNACFKGGLSIGSMVDASFSDYMSKCWSYGSATDAYGAYYTHTTQLLFMLCLTGNMPNFWDMNPVYLSGETDASGSSVILNFSKPINPTTASNSTGKFTITEYPTAEDAAKKTNGNTISVSSASVSSKVVTLNLSTDISSPYIYISYSGTTLKGTDGSTAAEFADKQIANKITSMEPYPIARYTDVFGTKVYIQWSKDVKLNSSTATPSDFTVYVNNSAVSAASSLDYYSDEEGMDKSIIALNWSESILSTSSDVITITYTGTKLTGLTGTKTAKPFTKAVVQNFYMSESCLDMYAHGSAETGSWTCTESNIPMETSYASSTTGYALQFAVAKPTAWERLVFTPNNDSKAEWNSNLADPSSRLVGRFYVTSMGSADNLAIVLFGGMNGDDLGYLPENAVFFLDGLQEGRWYDFDIPLSTPAVMSWQAYKETQKYSKLYIGSYSGTDEISSNYEIYIESFSLCPKKQNVVAETGKVAYDGSQIELNFTTAMKVPTDLSSIVVKEGSIAHTVSSIETKTGDASTLIFNLEDPITSGSATITASLAAETPTVKSNDGRKCSPFSVTLSNLVGCTTSTGWYDDFADANDYVTLNLNTGHFDYDVASDNPKTQAGSYSITEVAGSSYLEFAQEGKITWSSQIILSPYSAETHEGYVLDLSGDRGVITLSVKGEKAVQTVYYRIDIKDYFGNKKDGTFTKFTLTNSYKDIVFTPSFAGVDATAISEIQIRFITTEGSESTNHAPTVVNGSVYFDYISVGTPLYLSNFSPAAVLDISEGIDEDSQFTVKSSTDGYIFVVREDVNPQYSAMMAAVNAGEGTYTACTANTTATIDMTGMGYGYFKAYAYDPVTGSISSPYGCQVKDVTPPVFTDYYNGKTIPRDGMLYFTVDEDSEVYLVPAAADISSYANIVSSNPVGHWAVYGGDPKNIDLSTIDIESNVSYKLVAIDHSGNISNSVPTNNIKVLLPALAFTIDEAEVTVGDIILISSTPNRPTTAYLVLAEDDVDYDDVEDYAVITLEVGNLGKTQLLTESLNTITEATDYYLYLKDAEKEILVGPSLITVTPGTYELTSISLSVEQIILQCDNPKTVEVTFVDKRFSNQKLSFSGAEEYVEVSYNSAQNSGGTGVITLTGKKDSDGQYIPMTITSDADKNVKATLNIRVDQLVTDIIISDAPATVSQGASIPLNVIVEPAGLVSETNAELIWTTSDGSKASVSAGGVLNVKDDAGIGEVTLTATTKKNGCSNAKVTKSFTTSVTAASVTSIKVKTTTESEYVSDYVWEIANLGKTSSKTFGIEIKPDVSNTEDAQLTVVSSDESIVAIATALNYNENAEEWRFKLTYQAKQGQATVTVSSVENPAAYAVIHVKAGEVACETPAPTASEVSDLAICEGGNATLTATFTGSANAVWYDVATGGSALFTGNSYATGKTVADTYTYYVAKNDGCESVSRTPVTLTINAKPTATLASTIGSSYCATTESVALSASPATGTWSGTGVNGTTFSPATAGAGTHTVTYTIGETGCQSTYTKDIVVTAAPSVTLTVNKSMCSNDKPQILSATPTGGTWSGTGMTGSSFSPASGSSVVTYTYTDGPCEVVKTEEITVTENPTPVINGLETAYCADAADVTLSAAPEGGSFKVNEVAATKFSPATAAAENTVSYTVSVNGCEGTATKTVTVNALPTINLSSVPTTACAGQEITLAPTDGTWTGTGVTDTKFSSATAGEYELTYSVSENGCSASEDVKITVTKATAPTAAPVTVALGEAVPALTATGSGVINWYKSVDGESVSTGASYTPDNASTAADAVFTYYVTNTDAGCESEKVAVTLTVTGCTVTAPSVAAVDAICEGEDFPELEATGTESSFAWYDAITDGNQIATTAKFTPTAAGTYYAAQSSAECEGPRTSVVVEVKAKPAKPTATGASSCAGADLVAMTTVETANWYADKAAAAVATGVKTYTPSSLAETTTFYVNQVVNGCTSDFAEVVYTIKSKPSAPEVATSVACIGNTEDYNVEVTNSDANASLQWYDADKAPKGTDAKQAVSGVTTAKDYTYTVTQTVDGCTSDAASATLTVKALPVPEITLDARYALSIDIETPLSATPAGGTFTLDNKAATSFVPANMTEGTHTVVYTYTDGDGCIGTANATFEVFDSSDPAVESISLSKASATLTVGGSVTLTPTILPVEGTDNKAVLWSSSDETVATVDQNGVVKGVGVGSATITALATYKPGDKSATCAVTVEAKVVPVESASFKDGYKTTAEAGEEIDLSSYVTYAPEDATGVTITWAVFPASAGTVTNDGKFTAGTVYKNTSVAVVATVTAGGVEVEAEADITVLKSPIPVTAIEVSVPTQLEAGSSYQATATIVPSDADDKSVVWTISNSNATIDAQGNVTVTGASGSSFDVVATASNGVVGKATVEIIDEIIPVTGASIAAGEYVVTESGELNMADFLSFEPSNASIKSIEWKCPSGYVDINPSTGLVKGKTTSSQREVMIQVLVTSLDGEQVSAKATIILKKDPKYVSSISIDNALSLEEGSSYSFVADVNPSNADDRTVTWSIKSGNGGSIDPETGDLEITGSEGDKFVVVATANDNNKVESNECTVTVLKKTIPVQEIMVSTSSVDITAGKGNQTISVSFSPANTTQTKYTVVTNSSIFSYVDDEKGHITITGNQGGTATLTIKSWDNPSVMKSIEVKVTELVKYITVTGTSVLNVGDKVTFSAYVGETTATNKACSWSSSDPSVATVDAKGLVTAVAAGSVEIKATALDGSEVEGSAYLTVSVVPVTKVSATTSLELEIDQTATIQTKIEPYNATYQTLVYESSNESIVTVTSDGFVSAVGVGEATITVTAPGDGTAPVSTTTIVKVTPVRADMTYLGSLIFNDQWGAYAINAKIAAKELIVGWGRGQITPLVNNEFQAAAIEANNIYWLEETVGTFPTQEEVDAAAQRLYKAIVAMGMKDVEKPDAIDDVASIDAKVFPTKVTSFVTIEADNMVSVKIVSITGKVVAQEMAAGDEIEINTSMFAQGVYRVIIETENGTVVKGFVK